MNYFKSITLLLMALSFTPLTQSMEAPLPPKKEEQPVPQLELLLKLREERRSFLNCLPQEVIVELYKFTCLGTDPAALFWNYQLSKKLITKFEINEQINATHFNNKKQLLFLATPTKIIIYDIKRDIQQIINESNVTAMVYNNKNNTLIVARTKDLLSPPKIKVFNLETGECLKKFTENQAVNVKQLLLISNNRIVIVPNLGELALWDLNSCTRLDSIDAGYMRVCLHKKNNILYVIKDENVAKIKVFNLETGAKFDITIPNFNHIGRTINLFGAENKERIDMWALDKRNNQLFLSIRGTIRILNLKDNTFNKVSFKHPGACKLFIDTKSNCLISMGQKFKIWDLSRNQLLTTLNLDEDLVAQMLLLNFLDFNILGLNILAEQMPCIHFNKKNKALIFAFYMSDNRFSTIATLNLEDQQIKLLLQSDINKLQLARATFAAYLNQGSVKLADDQRLYNAFNQLPEALKKAMEPYILMPGQESWSEWILGKRNK